MPRTYKAIFVKDRVEWKGEAPDQEKPVDVHITALESAPPPKSRTGDAVAALQTLADRGTFSHVTDPAAWQREIRQDRPLPVRAD